MELFTLYNKSIENSYKILFEDFDFEKMIFNESGELEYIFFTEPGEIPNREEIEEMIEYFEIREEYEKCHQLKNLKNKHTIAGVDFTESINNLNNLF